MLVADFLMFVGDCRFARPGLTTAAIQQIVQKVVPDVDREGAHRLSKRKFLEIVVRMAVLHAIATGEVITQGYTSGLLLDILQKDIIPRALVSQRHQFKHVTCRDPHVQEILTNQANIKILSKLFRAFSTAPTGVHNLSPERTTDSSGDTLTIGGPHSHQQQQPSLARESFVQIFVDAHLLERNLTKSDLVNIFRDVQDCDTDDDPRAMSFADMCDAMVAVALIKVPYPIMALHTRVSMLLQQSLFPAIRTHLNKKSRSSLGTTAEGR
jgi:hypothetical protein